jgi:hypothetical protein
VVPATRTGDYLGVAVIGHLLLWRRSGMISVAAGEGSTVNNLI